MSLNSYDSHDVMSSNNPSVDDEIKTQAEELLRDEYLSYDNSIRWSIDRAKLFLNREKRLQQIMDKLTEQKKAQKKDDLATIDYLKSQLNDDQIVVNTDRTPVWSISTDDLVKARRDEVGEQIKNKDEIVVNADRTPVWQINPEKLMQKRRDEVGEQIENKE